MALTMGAGVQIYGGARLTVERPVHMAPGVIVMSGMRIGAFTYFGEHCVLGSAKSIGRYCSFAPGAMLGLGKHPKHYLSTSPVFFRSAGMFPSAVVPNIGVPRPAEFVGEAPVIGHDVWVGANAVILRGVEIGVGAIVGAGAFVRENVRPYAIVAGSPAKEVARRFDDLLVDRLLALQWWNYDPSLLAGTNVSDVAGQIALMEERLANATPMVFPSQEVVGPIVK